MARLILLGLVWAALSAATAYFADLWGRKLGKQRKSLFGWRPKQTAVFIITSAGALIALLSFAVLLIANAGIRKALLQWDQTVEQLEASNAQMSIVNAQMKEMQAATTQQQARLAAAQAARENSERALSLARTNLLAQEKRVAAAQQTVREIESKLRSEQAVLGTTRRQLSSTTTELRGVERSLSLRTTELSARKKQLASAERELADAERELTRLQDRVKVASAQAEKALEVAEQALLGNLAVYREEELVRRVVPPCRTLHEAREQIQRALNDTSLIVQQRTAERNPRLLEPMTDFVRLPKKTIVQDVGGKRRTQTFTEEQVRDAVAIKLMPPNSPSPGGIVLQVVSTMNAAAGEPVTVDFNLYENHVVFERDEMITQFVVNEGESREQVMNDITLAMQEVSREARRKGLLPRAGNTVTAPSIFQLAEAYNRVVDALARGQNRVPVIITADDTTWTAGPLDVRIRVRRSEDET